MKLIESSIELLKQEPGMSGINKMIELAGRTCYKSEDKITEDSAEAFVQRMINSHHTAMLEHGTVYLKIQTDSFSIGKYHHEGTILTSQFEVNPYSKVHYDDAEVAYITTNYRSLLEYFDEEDVEFILSKYLCEPTEFHERRISLKFTTDRGVSNELIRHRVFSFAQESTRYCNYSKDKFGNEITFIIPSWLKCKDIDCKSIDVMNSLEFKKYCLDKKSEEFVYTIGTCEWHYLRLLQQGLKPQEARQILPNALKTEIVMTGFASDWRHFFDLRLFCKTGNPHPDMLLLTEKAKKILEENDLWDYIMSFPSKFE